MGVFEKIQKTLERESDACRSRISEQKTTATTTIGSARLSEGGEEDNAEVLNNLDEKSAAVCEISTEFKNKFLSDLKPWINKRSEKVKMVFLDMIKIHDDDFCKDNINNDEGCGETRD